MCVTKITVDTLIEFVLERCNMFESVCTNSLVQPLTASYLHIYNLHLYTIKNFKANKLVGSCTKYLLLTEFTVRTVSYGPSFPPFDLWPKLEARGS